ncbi:hypothetical protein ACFL2G_03430 [Candidatus Omnitrophota bacterium]
MKKIAACLCVIFIFGFYFIQTVWADAETDAILDLLIQKGVITQRDVDSLRAEVGKKLEETPESQCPVKSVECLDAIKLGGVLDVRYQDSEGEEATFKMNEFTPYVDVDFTDKISGRGKIKATPDGVTLNEAWVKYDDIALYNGTVKFGKFARGSFGYYQGDGVDGELLYRAFIDNKQAGIEYSTEFPEQNLPFPVTFAFGVCNGSEITTAEVGDNAFSPVEFIADGAGDADDNQSKEVSARVTVQPNDYLKVGISGLYGQLSPVDITALNTSLGTAYTDDVKRRYGVDVAFNHPLEGLGIVSEIRAEYLCSETSDFDVDAWYGILCFKFFDEKLDLFTRYSEYNPDIATRTTASETWELYQTTIGASWNFTDRTQLLVEYEFNGENTPAGVSEVDNDMLKIKSKTEF